jgi:hypothetical protein
MDNVQAQNNCIGPQVSYFKWTQLGTCLAPFYLRTKIDPVLETL